MKKKLFWTYLVDSYERDLASIAWWVHESGFHINDRVCLMPTKEFNANFLFKEKPDILVWNYARNNNIKIIKIAKLLNIYNIIHDTEGIHYSKDTYFNINLKHFTFIDEIWCWGENQAKDLKNKTKLLKNKPLIKNIGSIRYEYIKTLKKIDLNKNKGKLLWNTNYAALDPRFQSAFQEYKEFFKLHKYLPEEKAFNLFLKLASRRQSAYEVIRNLCEDNKDIELTIRPHPFESERFYIENELQKSSKIEISRGNDINNDLEKTSLVIQNGCQTVIESYLRGIPSIKTSNEEINIWSNITPIEKTKNLSKKINDIQFIKSIYLKQKELFKIYKIDKYLNNLNKPLSEIKKPSLKEKKFPPNLINKIYLLKVKFKLVIKSILGSTKNIDLNKKHKLNTSDIKYFLEEKYNYKSYLGYEYCFLDPSRVEE